MMRNMVIAEKDKLTLRPETLHLHDMMREVCLFKAEEDNFLQIIDFSSSTLDSLSARTSRRFGFQHPTTLHVESNIRNPKVRSVLIIPHKLHTCKLQGLSFKKLQLLRLLDLSRVEFEERKLPSSIGKLIHLRYLSLEDADVNYLPSSLQNLKLLIRTDGRSCWVPNILMGMQELRYLALPKSMEHKKLELSSLVNLETLENFSSENSSLEDLRGLTRLRILKINNSGSSSSESISSSICGMRHLESLDIDGSLSTSTTFVFDCNHLKILKLSIYMPRLPDEQHFPSHLTVIDLNCCRLEEDPMPILEKMHHLYEVKLKSEAFCGSKMVCSAGGFPQLHMLEFLGLHEWIEWELEEGAMPLLHTLSLSDCKKLRCLPQSLRYITSLDVVMMRSMNGHWDDDYEKGGAGLRAFNHIPNFSYEGDYHDSYYYSD